MKLHNSKALMLAVATITYLAANGGLKSGQVFESR